MILETERLVLRPWRTEDAADLYEQARDERVGRAADWPAHRSVEESLQIIRTVFSAEEIYAVELRATGRAVGCIGLLRGAASHLCLPDDEAEVGYWIGVPYWGEGLIPEALAALVRRAFDSLGLAALWCCSFTDNPASRRVWEKCGFSYIRTEPGGADGANGADKADDADCAREADRADGADSAVGAINSDKAHGADRADSADGANGGSDSAAKWPRAVHIARLGRPCVPERRLTLRRAGEQDIPLIRRLAGEVFPATYREILTPAQLDYMMEWMYSDESLRGQFRAGHVWFIASSDGEPCGYLSVERQGEDLFHLQKIYVLPRFQGIGAGAFLFRQAVEYIRSVHSAPCRMELNVNRRNPALRFYERIGMRRVGEGDFPIGDGYFMNDYIMGIEIE